MRLGVHPFSAYHTFAPDGCGGQHMAGRATQSPSVPYRGDRMRPYRGRLVPEERLAGNGYAPVPRQPCEKAALRAGSS